MSTLRTVSARGSLYWERHYWHGHSDSNLGGIVQLGLLAPPSQNRSKKAEKSRIRQVAWDADISVKIGVEWKREIFFLLAWMMLTSFQLQVMEHWQKTFNTFSISFLVLLAIRNSLEHGYLSTTHSRQPRRILAATLSSLSPNRMKILKSALYSRICAKKETCVQTATAKEHETPDQHQAFKIQLMKSIDAVTARALSMLTLTRMPRLWKYMVNTQDPALQAGELGRELMVSSIDIYVPINAQIFPTWSNNIAQRIEKPVKSSTLEREQLCKAGIRNGRSTRSTENDNWQSSIRLIRIIVSTKPRPGSIPSKSRSMRSIGIWKSRRRCWMVYSQKQAISSMLPETSDWSKLADAVW